MAEITIKSYGKVNLSLDICGIREDGYHVLESVMHKISLCDDVNVKWTSLPQDHIEINLTCNKRFLPTDDRNLAYKGAKLMIEAFGKEIGGGIVDIHIEKHLPVAAGLAGGSGNGAAVLVALNRLWELNLDTKKLCEMGAVLGADVPFCLLIQNTKYKCALCEGTGTELTPIKSKLKKAVLLVKPSFGVSTKEVYQGIDNCEIEERPNTESLVQAMKEQDQETIYDNMVNVLEEYTLKAYEDVQKIKDKIKAETTAEKVLMTGSGPTVFAFFDTIAAARKACYNMRKQGYEAYWALTK
ncbi:MAG: 4-(cytidine 5'-diphospho)-2-C-methyl-D-erythritol kinase [Firmicutes bacterium]|nr:4-(cytidine 5'-diphospho)-2-C-methyl-D-erythritol kinase [Bacillota bacterium]